MDKIANTLFNKLAHWSFDLIRILPNLVIAAIVIILGTYIVKRLKGFIKKRIVHIFPTPTLANLTISVIYAILLLVIYFIALRVLGLDGTIKSVLAGAGIIGLGLAFAFQDFAANFISGIFLAFRKPFYKGEIIRVDDLEGFVVEVRLRDTTIKTYQGQFIIIPNKNVFQNPIINYTRLGKRRADIKAGISKRNDLKKAREVATKSLENVPQIIYKDSQVLFREIKGNSTYFVAECWVDTGNFNEYKHFINNCIIAMDEAFKANDITMLNQEFILDFNDSAEKIKKPVKR